MKTWILVLITSFFGFANILAQQAVVDQLMLVDPTTGKSITLQKPSGLANNLTFNFPSTTGTLGQTLTIGSVSGNNVNFGWQTAAKSFASLSSRLTSQVTTALNGTPATRCSVAVDANRTYRIQGIIRGGRTSTGCATTGAADIVRFSISAPTNTSAIQLGVRCYDCPSGTTGVPSLTTAAATTLTTGSIDPSGSGTTAASGTAYAYQLDGFFTTGASSGDFFIWITEDGTASSLCSFMSADSFIVLTELN